LDDTISIRPTVIPQMIENVDFTIKKLNSFPKKKKKSSK